MHELSIAVNIVDIAKEQMDEHGASRILSITLEVGKLSGVVMEALEFALEEAVRDTVLEATERKIIEIPGKAECKACNTTFTTDDYITVCTNCGSYDTKLVSGKELSLKAMDIE